MVADCVPHQPIKYKSALNTKINKTASYTCLMPLRATTPQSSITPECLFSPVVPGGIDKH